jgi:hypothetical protein
MAISKKFTLNSLLFIAAAAFSAQAAADGGGYGSQYHKDGSSKCGDYEYWDYDAHRCRSMSSTYDNSGGTYYVPDEPVYITPGYY